MATIKFTRALKRFYPDLQPFEVEVATVADVITDINQRYPGLADYLVDEHGKLRQHVNIFIENTLIRDRTNLSDQIDGDAEVYIMQALSGG